MKVLVIGGLGYIGAHVVKALLKTGAQVTVFDNLSNGVLYHLQPGADFWMGDIRNVQDLTEVCESNTFDSIIHLAALKAAGESMLKPEQYAETNITGSINILNCAVAHGIKNIVFSSSAAVYGEAEYLPVDEAHPKNPTSFYGHTKLVVEGLLAWYGALKGIRHASLRYFNAVGYDVEGKIVGHEEESTYLIPNIMDVAAGKKARLQIFGGDHETKDGTCIRDYIHVTDLAEAHVQALQMLSIGASGYTVNLGTSKGYTVMEIIEKAMEVTGRPIPFDIVPRRPGDPSKVTASCAQAKEQFGWEAKHSDLDTFLRTTWNAYLENERIGKTINDINAKEKSWTN